MANRSVLLHTHQMSSNSSGSLVATTRGRMIDTNLTYRQAKARYALLLPQNKKPEEIRGADIQIFSWLQGLAIGMGGGTTYQAVESRRNELYDRLHEQAKIERLTSD